jgi:DNA-binding response OmpR family regulator
VNILIVDDDEPTRELITSYLAESGYCVRAAENVARAVELMNELRPDVVLTDLWMPGLSGVELVAHVRVLHKTLPVIMLSGNATDADQERALRAGASLMLQKPVRLEQLMTLIEFAR